MPAEGLAAEAASVRRQLLLHLGFVRIGVGATELLVGRSLGKIFIEQAAPCR